MTTWYDDLVARIKGGDLSTHNGEKWEPSTWPAEARASGSSRRRAARWGTGSTSRTARSSTTRPSCRAPGTARRVTRRACWDRTRRRWWTTIRWSIPNSRIEILRTIHSFDPCLACGVHVLDASGARDHGGEGAMTTPAASLHPHAGPQRTVEPPVTPAPGAACSTRCRRKGDTGGCTSGGLPLRAMHWIAALSHRGAGGHRTLHRQPVLHGQAQGTQQLRHAMWAPVCALRAPRCCSRPPALVRIYWLIAGQPVRALRGALPGAAAGHRRTCSSRSGST